MIAISFLKGACRTLALMTIPKHRVVSITIAVHRRDFRNALLSPMGWRVNQQTTL